MNKRIQANQRFQRGGYEYVPLDGSERLKEGDKVYYESTYGIGSTTVTMADKNGFELASFGAFHWPKNVKWRRFKVFAWENKLWLMRPIPGQSRSTTGFGANRRGR